MPTNKVLADDDPELLELLKGGGLKADTIKDRERFLGQFKEFVLKETGGVALEDLVLTKEGLERLDKLFPKYFLIMEVTVTEKGAGGEEEAKAWICKEGEKCAEVSNPGGFQS